MKMWGKSPRRPLVIKGADKPCGLKCHVHHVAISNCGERLLDRIMGGRQIEPIGDNWSR